MVGTEGRAEVARKLLPERSPYEVVRTTVKEVLEGTALISYVRLDRSFILLFITATADGSRYEGGREGQQVYNDEETSTCG